ncbi:TIGR03435 family protein [Pedosphaera parvula]|uniref:RNA polymerase, sigma-24 subunit, ECF subfamily n=1 Tax=Pedosphaera parvula (strain Ellin514) TaxID=320771 RepID=B9XEF2_PEDPL|nr:TIGR03435 family protein [Pedosphaera parvula]EEF61666.1 RNA polymerase, sigma-24 subunit, ECF subfamily [Pedosphaera parvula Ellin514]
MPDVDDIALLRKYADCNSESAFAEIVHRHINLVYSVALRYVDNSPDAQDVAQAVFIILAQKAASLSQRTILTGWLYETTRFTAMNFLTSKTRRQAREQKAYMESTLNDSNSENVWRQLEPLLEEAMIRLSEKERTLVALRFFENKSAAETAAVLGIQEWAAHKRAARAMEKLRKFFIKRGIASTTATLALAISANSVHAAPAVLAKATTASAFAKGAMASPSTLSLVKGALKIMAWSKAKTTIVVGLSVLLAVGTATITVKKIAAHRHEVWQEKFDLSVLDKVPAQANILASLPITIQSDLHVTGMRNEMALGLGESIPDLLTVAYGVGPAQLILTVPVPDGKYDFIANLTTGVEANQEALRQEIKKKFGLIGRRETIETNVLFLTVQSRNAAGLKPAAGQSTGSQGNDYYSAHNQSIPCLVGYLERSSGVAVIDQTGLTNNFDIDFKWDSTFEGLKQVLLDKLGLKLTLGRQSMEFVVVEKAN